MARPLPRHAIDARSDHVLPRAVRRKPARHSDAGVCRHCDRLPGVRHRADDDWRGKILHQPVVRAVRYLPRRRGESLRVRQRPARHGRRQHRLQRADRRHDDDPDDEAHRLHAVLFRGDRGLRLDRRSAGAAGARRNRVRDGAVHEHQLLRRRPRRDAALSALLCRPVHAGRCLCGPAQAEGPAAQPNCRASGMRSRRVGTTCS